MFFFTKYKKIFFVVGFVGLSLGLLFLLIWLFFIPDKPQPGEPGYVPPGAYLPETGEGGNLQELLDAGKLPIVGNVPAKETETSIQNQQPDIIARGYQTYTLPLIENKTIGLALSTDKQGIVFYDQSEQKFFRISADGQSKIALSNEEFYNVQDVAWSPDSTRAVITYPDGIKVYYDFSTKKKVTLPKELDDIEFAPQTNKIGFKFESADIDNNFLGVAKPDGTNAQVLEETADQGRFFQVEFSPNEDVAAFYQQPTGANSSEIFLIGQKGENFKSFNIEGARFEAKWSPRGGRLLYDVVMVEYGFRPMLWVAAANGAQISNYKVSLGLYTWVDKCVFTSETEIYCAVPKDMPEGAGIYKEAANNSGDIIYQIDLTANRKKVIADPVLANSDAQFKISKMQVSGDGKFLFFFDNNSEKIYSLRLK